MPGLGGGVSGLGGGCFQRINGGIFWDNEKILRMSNGGGGLIFNAYILVLSLDPLSIFFFFSKLRVNLLLFPFHFLF